jgi:toxin HigB-1
MELAFGTVGLRRVCESDIDARKQLPAGTAEDLQDRLADIRAASAASDLVAGKPSLDGQPPGRIRFSLDGGYVLVCVGNHPRPPLLGDGSVDFSRMRRVRVIVIAQESANG